MIIIVSTSLSGIIYMALYKSAITLCFTTVGNMAKNGVCLTMLTTEHPILKSDLHKSWIYYALHFITNTKASSDLTIYKTYLVYSMI